METLSAAGSRTSRVAHRQFLQDVAPFRDDLFRFCRSLTNSPWDAEDLVQETLLKIYGRMGDTHAGIKNPKSYLFKTAANLWIDWCRRASLPLESDEVPAKPFQMGCSMEVRSALARTLQFLPPRERLAFVLKDVFEFTLEEIAEISQTSLNSVKAALHRARSKLPAISQSLERAESAIQFERIYAAENKQIIDQLAAAFNKRDLEGMCSLFLSTATGNGPGCFLENGIAEIKRGSLFYTNQEVAPMRAECVSISGELFFVLWLGDVLDDVWRIKVTDGVIAGFDCYYCSPLVLKEIAEILGAASSHHGYYYEDTAAGQKTE